MGRKVKKIQINQGKEEKGKSRKETKKGIKK